MDVSQSELFINNGEVVMSNLLFPEDFYKVKLFATGGDLVIEKSIIYEMDEIMNHPLDGDLIWRKLFIKTFIWSCLYPNLQTLLHIQKMKG